MVYWKTNLLHFGESFDSLYPNNRADMQFQ